MGKRIEWVDTRRTEHGFQIGNIVVSACCQNDGRDKRAKWAAISIATPAGVWDIQSDAKGDLIIAKRPGGE